MTNTQRAATIFVGFVLGLFGTSLQIVWRTISGVHEPAFSMAYVVTVAVVLIAIFAALMFGKFSRMRLRSNIIAFSATACTQVLLLWALDIPFSFVAISFIALVSVLSAAVATYEFVAVSLLLISPFALAPLWLQLSWVTLVYCLTATLAIVAVLTVSANLRAIRSVGSFLIVLVLSSTALAFGFPDFLSVNLIRYSDGIPTSASTITDGSLISQARPVLREVLTVAARPDGGLVALQRSGNGAFALVTISEGALASRRRRHES